VYGKERVGLSQPISSLNCSLDARMIYLMVSVVVDVAVFKDTFDECSPSALIQIGNAEPFMFNGTEDQCVALPWSQCSC
jgi:hypothetical protein